MPLLQKFSEHKYTDCSQAIWVSDLTVTVTSCPLIYFIYLRLPLFLLLPTNGASPVCSVLSPAKGKHRDTNGLSATDRNMKTCRRAWHKVPKRHVQLVRATQNIMLCFYWMEIKILVQTPWQRSDERENSEAQGLVCWLDFFLLSIFDSALHFVCSVNSVHVITWCLHDFRDHVPWQIGSFRGSCFSHFWSPCLPCFDGQCCPDWMKTGRGPFSVNFNISKLLRPIFHHLSSFATSFSARFTNLVKYLSATVSYCYRHRRWPNWYSHSLKISTASLISSIFKFQKIWIF